MRRCLHASLVGVLLLSLSMNAARACWYLRHAHPARHHVVVACPPAFAAWPVMVQGPVVEVVEVVDTWGDECGEVATGWSTVADVAVEGSVVVDACACDGNGTVFEAEVEPTSAAWVEEHEGEQIIAEPVAEEVMHHEQAAAPAHEVTEAVAAPQPTLAEPREEQPAPEPAAVPVLEPTAEVRQAVALDEPESALKPEPTAEPAAEPQPDVVLPAEPMPKTAVEVVPPAAPPAVESNIFEEVDQAASGAEPRGVEAVREEPAASAAATPEPLPVDAPETEPSVAAPEAAPAPAEETAPADPFAAASPVSREPARRWIDASGDYAVVARLRAVRGDGTCELEAAGRTIEVSLEALSAFDRAYATRASERLAVRAAPADTAGL